MAEKRTTYKIQDIEGIGEVQIADEVVTIIAGLAAIKFIFSILEPRLRDTLNTDCKIKPFIVHFYASQ